MENLKQVSDEALILELYRRMEGNDEMSLYRNYCYRSAFRPVMTFFDKNDADESNLRSYKMADWNQLKKERDEALTYFPDTPD